MKLLYRKKNIKKVLYSQCSKMYFVIFFLLAKNQTNLVLDLQTLKESKDFFEG